MARVSGIVLACLSLFGGYSSGAAIPSKRSSGCTTVGEGYHCFTNISRIWGQYSPYWSLKSESEISPDIPEGCHVTFAQVLSRHGARYPSSDKSKEYKELIEQIQKNATSKFTGKYAFLNSYNYSLGSDILTDFGRNQLIDSGTKFYKRYENLAKTNVPFVRSSDSGRVIESGERFADGFQQTKTGSKENKPKVSVIFPENDWYNNTLEHGTCTNFENDPFGDEVMANYTHLFAPSIRQRLESDIPGIHLTDNDIVSLMDMCPFEVVAKTADASQLSPFCALFSASEWQHYNYYRTLEKFYGYGNGNPLGPTQGVGFTNELIARLTGSRAAALHDHTSVNHTVDSNPGKFPVGKNATRLFADFSHENSMVTVFSALGLYNHTWDLSREHIQGVDETDGFVTPWVVPFASRMYVEAMQCSGEESPLVRAIVNDRVRPLQNCDADKLGRCKLDEFVEGLSFARSGGHWDKCFS